MEEHNFIEDTIIFEVASFIVYKSLLGNAINN